LAVLQHHVGDIGIGDIADLLRGHHDDSVLSPHGFQPVLEPGPEQLMLQVRPGLIEQNQRRWAIQALFNAAETGTAGPG